MNILIVGATSAIAEAAARIWACDGARLHLVARNPEKLRLISADLQTRGAKVSTAVSDLADVRLHQRLVEDALVALTEIDVALIAHGELPNQQSCETSVESLVATIQTNALSTVSLMTLLANDMERRHKGVIVVIGSVAGDRGRRSNYAYGSAKAMVAAFAEGLGARLLSSGVAVINIQPGFVDTPMTAKFKKGALWAQPETIARIIHARAAARISGRYYAPRFWWLIMNIVKHVPQRIFLRMNI